MINSRIKDMININMIIIKEVIMDSESIIEEIVKARFLTLDLERFKEREEKKAIKVVEILEKLL